MKIYNIQGYAPDWCETFAQHGVSEIKSTEEQALIFYNHAKHEIINFLKEERAAGTILDFGVKEHRAYFNEHVLASMVIDVSIDPEQEAHLKHFVEYGLLGTSYGLSADDITINSNRVTYRLADITIYIKELKIETK